MMNNLKLSEQELIEAVDQNEHVIMCIPERQILENIPIIWKMLEQILEDWSNVSHIYPSVTKIKRLGNKSVRDMNAFELIKPRLFQCLFSYIIFFFMLENGYKFVYNELNQINRKLGLQIHHKKAPKRTEFIDGLWRVRNFTVAHWAGTEKMNLSDSIAGRQWGYAFITPVKNFEEHEYNWENNIEHIIPGLTGIVMASIPETHNKCSEYLHEFDQVCADYLATIITQMPKTQNGVEYHAWKWTDSGMVTNR